MFQPLKGLRVVDLSQVLAGPYATYLLGLMGAEVIKIEKPGEGDWTRVGGGVSELSERKLGLSYLVQGGNKKSVTLDLKTPEGLDVAKRLVATSDIFIENFKPGVAERLGLGFEAVKAVSPKVVYCSISAFGQTGPFSGRPAYDHVIQGMCGIMLTTGQPGSGPNKVGAPYVDYATGMNAAFAVVSGVLEAQRTGKPVQVDVSMLDTSLMLMASLMSTHLTTGWVPQQTGNEAWSQSPSSGAFQTAEGVLMLAANNEPQFQRMCQAIGAPDILQDPRWSTPDDRRENASALRDKLNAIFLTRPAAEWEAILADATVPAGRVRGLEEILHEDQIAARGLMSTLEIDGLDRPVHVPALSFVANGKPTPATSAPSVLGADTDVVLGALGFDDGAIEGLRKAGVI
jgi:formyl-CoA transferase